MFVGRFCCETGRFFITQLFRYLYDMAKFSTAESITGKFEGLYANNPADNGKETYAGIARKFWPKWDGWLAIDKIKKQYGTSAKVINSYASKNVQLTESISEFYKTNFWDTMNLDDVRDQQLANTVYDYAVNSGTHRAATTLQTAVNDTGLVKLTVDGKIGVKSIDAVNKFNPAILYTNYNSRRETFYRSIAKGNQTQFLKSWLNRLKPYKTCS